MIDRGQLVAPEEVRREIEAGQDELVVWIHRNPQLFVPTTPQLVDTTVALVRKHRELAGLEKTKLHADPWVVALAILHTDLINQGIVIADESPRRSSGIPAVCQAEDVACLTHIQWFDQEGWGFA